jgi:RNA-dependent RNA polymerase
VLQKIKKAKLSSEKETHIIKMVAEIRKKLQQPANSKKAVSLAILSKTERRVFREYIQQTQFRQNISGKVMVTRNPCMHPADIRTAICIDKDEARRRFELKHKQNNYFEELVNCVIFSKKEKIPLTAQISGSDLDGDIFFISWD